MAQDIQTMIEKLNDLIALDHDAVGAYEAAIQRIDVPVLRERLTEFQLDHRRHIRDLSAIVTRLGGEPKQGPDVKGFFIKGFTAATSAMGTTGALTSMMGNEKLTNLKYTNALELGWPDDIRLHIERNLADERRHLAFIEDALRNRSWEQTQPPAR